MRTASHWYSVNFGQTLAQRGPLRYRLAMATLPARDATKTIKINITPAPRRRVEPQPAKRGSRLGRSFGYVVVIGCLAWLVWVALAA